MMLIQRGALSVLSSCYGFCRQHYVEETEIWPSVRRELELIDGLLPLLYKNLESMWSPQVMLVDASPS
eukprot:916950-Amphidinium_carterae.1